MRNFRKRTLFSVPDFAPRSSSSTQTYKNVQCLTDNEGQISGTFPRFPNTFTFPDLLAQLADRYSAFAMYGSINHQKTEWTSYSEFYELVKAVSASLQRISIDAGNITAVLIDNNVYFPLAQWSLACIGAIMIPVDTSYDAPVIEQILSVFKCKNVIVSTSMYSTLQNILITSHISRLERVVLFADAEECSRLEDETACRLGSDLSIPFFTLPELLEQKSEFTPVKLLASHVCVINVGAGRGGSLNPVCLSHSNLIAAAAGIESCGYHFTEDVYMPTMHMSKAFERSMQLAVLANGGSIGFCHCGDNILTSIALVQPTIVSFTGDKALGLAESVVGQAVGSNWFKRLVFDFAFSVAAQAIESHIPVPWFIRAAVIDPFKCVVGERLRLIVTSCNDLDPRVQHALRTMLQVPVVQIYGTTETGGVICSQRVDDTSVDNVGAPTRCCEIKIRDFERGKQKVHENEPGEILVRGPNVFCGYHRNKALTSKALLEDGWFATGDIGKINSDGTIMIVDTITDWERRRKRSNCL